MANPRFSSGSRYRANSLNRPKPLHSERQNFKQSNDEIEDDFFDAPSSNSNTNSLNHQSRSGRIIRTLTRWDVGFGGLLLLALAVGIFIGFFMKQNAEERSREQRLSLAKQEAQNRPKLVVSLHPQEEALRQYYEERLEDLPAYLRFDPNAAPEDAKAASDITTIIPESPNLQDGAEQPPWLRYAAAASTDAQSGLIAIVIDDIGLDKPRSKRAIKFEHPITLAFLPYGDNLSPLIEDARQNGHDIMLHLPMEPVSAHIDPGPNALRVNLPWEELENRIEWNFSRMDGFVGVNNHMGSRFTGDQTLMAKLLKLLDQRGLLFLDSVTTKHSQGYRIAQTRKMPHAVRDVFIDHDLNPEAINRQLALIEKTAREKGHVVAIGHPHDLTLKALERWLPTLAQKGLTPVPITLLVKRQQGITNLANKHNILKLAQKR